MSYRKKLIEVALPLEDINREAAREKSIRHGHPSTLHLWWARRPLAACRAVLFASLVDDPSECVKELLADAVKRPAAEKELKARKKAWAALKAIFTKASGAGMKSVPDPGAEPKLEDVIVEVERERLFNIIRELVKWENSNNERVLDAARAEIMRSCSGEPPPVYDPFCGGGSIPLEAQRLGLEAHASDLNPVPVLINKALIEIPPKFAGKPPVNPESKKKLSASGSWRGAAGLAEDIRYYGQWMRDEAEKRVGHLYPTVKLPKERGGGEATVIAWLWARTSPNPAAKGAHVPLVRQYWLSTKPGKRAWVQPVVDQRTMTYRFEIKTGDGEPQPGTVSRNGGVCLLTGSPMPLDHIRAEGKAKRLGARLMAIVVEGPKGRLYLPPSPEHEQAAQCAQLPDGIPDTDLPKQALGFRVQNYGMTKHRDLFTSRQLLLLATFCNLVGEVRVKATKDGNGDTKHADAVATYLALAVSRMTHYWSNLSSWHSGGEKMQPVFARQAISMVWDFSESNAFCESSGNWIGSRDWVAEVVDRFPCVPAGVASQLNAEKLPEQGGWLFSTDPPYYDNVPYADLSDFFYVWLKQMLKTVYPELLSTVLVPKVEELVAEPFRHGGKEQARAFFEAGMGRVFARIQALSDSAFPTTVFYAFKQAEAEEDDSEQQETSQASTGWETMLEAMLRSGWQIDGTWPMRTEMAGRARGRDSNALASSIVLVCRPRSKEASVASRRDFLA